MGFHSAGEARKKRHKLKRAIRTLSVYAPNVDVTEAQSVVNILQEVEDREVIDGLQASMLANPSAVVHVIAANIRFFRNRQIR